MDLTGLDLGAWLTESGAVVLLYEYDEVTQVFIGHVVHPMREVRYGKDGRLVSCCFLAGESQTVEHEQKLHAALHLDRKLGDVDAIITVNQAEWVERSGGAALAPHEDWVGSTDSKHVLMPGIDWISQDGLDWWTKILGGESIGKLQADYPSSQFKFRCIRHNHPNFAPARRQDSTGAGIYDEMPPLVNTYADRTLNANKWLKDAVRDAKMVFDTATSAEIEAIPAPLREWRVLTPGGCWETVVADEVCTCNTSVDMYRNKRQVGFFVNPQAVIAGCEVSAKPVVPTVTLDMLHPLGDTLDHLYRLIVHGVSSVAEKDAVAACIERFNNLVKTVRGE